MFPYSFGVQAPSKDGALDALTDQTNALVETHPEDSKKYSSHLAAVHSAAGALVDLLPGDDPDEPSDVAISAAGHLIATDADVRGASVHIAVERRPTDPSKHHKRRKTKAAEDAPQPDQQPAASDQPS